jgi:hypothetical protein
MKYWKGDRRIILKLVFGKYIVKVYTLKKWPRQPLESVVFSVEHVVLLPDN